MVKPYRCWAEVDLAALRANLAWIRHRLGPDVKIITVVKADAYGHGLKQIAALLMQSGTDVFGVANLAEARVIRRIGRGWPILMLGACLPDEVDGVVEDEVMATVSSLEEAKQFSAVAGERRRLARLHLKVDTGMGRLGVAPERVGTLAKQIQALPGVRLSGVYTHYASVEDDAEFSSVQKERFGRALNLLVQTFGSFDYVHANNSGAILHEADTMFNTVRPGLLVYGVLPPGRRRQKGMLRRNLRPAITWKCRVSLIKVVAKGTPLSYGRQFVAPEEMTVATLTAGYGDGYMRSGSNRAYVLVGGKRCRLLGRITMDQMLADISQVQGVVPGEEVVLLGRQGRAELTANELAEWFGTVPWEVLTNISYRVPRLYRGGHAA